MSLFPWRSKVRASRGGGYELHLEDWERDVLAALPEQVVSLLETDDPSVRRLFPPVYDDPERDAEVARLMREDLVDRHRATLTTVARTASMTELSEEELNEWVAGLNQLRLVLGTQLGLERDDQELEPADDAEAQRIAVYHWLTMLQEDGVAALASRYG